MAEKETHRAFAKLKADYEKVVNAIANMFLEKQFGEVGEPPLTVDNLDVSWIADDVGTLLDYGGSWMFDFQDILTDLERNVERDEIFHWIEYCNDCHELGLTQLNYKSWLSGAPRYSDEEIKRLMAMKEDLDEKRKFFKNEVNEAIKAYKDGGEKANY